MITSGLVVDGVGHGLQAHMPYNHQAVAAAVHNHRMAYAEPPAYLKSAVPPPPQQQQQQQSCEPPPSATPEFLRPLPKPAPVNPLKTSRASAKYAAPAAAECRPVNLTAAKEPLPPPPPPPQVEHHLRLDDRHHPYSVYGHPRLYVSASPYHHHPAYPMHQPPAPPYGVYTSPYAPVIPRDARHHLMQPPPPQERRYPSPPNKNGCGGVVGVGSRASPSASPPEPFKVPNGRDSGKPPQQQQQPQPQQQLRILPPPPPTTTFAALAVNNNNNNNNNVVVAAAEPSPKKSRRHSPEPQSPPVKTSNFTKGSLIRLANGNVKKVEDMRTEDFLNSVESSVLHRIDASTVVRIEHVTDQSVAKGNMKITLSLGDQRNHQINGDNHNKKTSTATTGKSPQQVEMESAAEHPYFVFGRGWASCSPTKTLAKYGLTCQRLQVGDVCVSLTKRPAAAADSTTTAPATAPQGGGGGKRRHQQQHQQPPLPPPSMAVHQQQLHNSPQQQLHQQHHYHNNNNNNNNNNHHHHHSTAVQKAQIQLHHLQQQQQHLQQLSADDDKNGRNKRRWSAPDPEPAT